MKIGVIGLGMVGQTIMHALQFYHRNVVGYDKYKPSSTFEDALSADVLFIALPTPPKDGRLDISILLSVMSDLQAHDYSGIVVLKSTISLDSWKVLSKLNLRLVYCPEFLHEKQRLQDFVKPHVVVIAGHREDVDVVLRNVFYWLDPETSIQYLDPPTAIMTKLVMNAYASTKISFANEIKRICDDFNIDPRPVMQTLVLEGRAAAAYTDPMKGAFGGSCLPKDLDELIHSTPKSTLLKAVREVNTLIEQESHAKSTVTKVNVKSD
jgi:UDPglucose 6-dehydrogenase